MVVVCTLLPGKLGITGSNPEAGVLFRLKFEVLFVIYTEPPKRVVMMDANFGYGGRVALPTIYAFYKYIQYNTEGGLVHHVRVARRAQTRHSRRAWLCRESAWQDARLPLLPAGAELSPPSNGRQIGLRWRAHGLFTSLYNSVTGQPT